MFESYTPQNSVVLTANDDYFRARRSWVASRCATWRIQTPASSVCKRVSDVAAGVNEAQWVDRINAEGNLTADVFGVAEPVWINLNVTAEPLDDPLVREAIALAINRDEHAALRGAPVSELIASVAGAGHARRADGGRSRRRGRAARAGHRAGARING